MTVRVYLDAARVLAGPRQPGDLPAERLFVHAADLPELWVETESASLPGPGKSVAFYLSHSHQQDIGIERVVGTVERLVSKQTRARLSSV